MEVVAQPVAQEPINTHEVLAVLAYFAQHDNRMGGELRGDTFIPATEQDRMGGLRGDAFTFVTTQRSDLNWTDLATIGFLAQSAYHEYQVAKASKLRLPRMVAQERVWAILNALAFSRNTEFRRDALCYMAENNADFITEDVLREIAELATRYLEAMAAQAAQTSAP